MANEQVVLAALAGLVEPLRRLKMDADWQKVVPEGVLAAQTAANWLMAAQPAARGVRLRSVFGSIRTELGQAAPKPRYLPLKELALSQAVLFAEESAAVTSEGYAQHLKHFHTAAAAAGSNLEALLAVYQRYLWCVPGSEADVSLYDEARMVAALAACLTEGGEGAVLVGGDISGVQEFIYTITNKGATSSLRGRSFYLQLLTEAAARFVLRELGLPYTNLIYGGGGNFYILARASDQARLDTLRQKLSRILYKHHQGDLYLAIEGVALTAKDFVRPNSGKHPLSEKWGELARQVAVVKNRRFAELQDDELAILFAPQGHGGNEETQCVVCGREYAPKFDNTDEREQGKCEACIAYESLGRELRAAQYIAWTWKAHPQNAAPIKETTLGMPWYWMLRDLGFDVRIREAIKDLPANADVVWALSDDALTAAQKRGGFNVVARRFLVNVAPKLSQQFIADDGEVFEAGDIKPFEKLAKDSCGITRLGIFRADVDNLGKLFESGLGSNASLARIAALSFNISLFFEGWVGEIARQRNEERKKKCPERGDALYAIYSGGDDLFFVGSWDELVEFAWQVNQDLKNYTGGHPRIHISGGMVLVTEKYPLAKAAKDAEQAEKAAKGLAWWDEKGEKHKKNVFAFLGQPLPWDEFANVRELKARLVALDDNKRMAVIRKLLMNYALYAEAQQKRCEKGEDQNKTGKPQILYGPWNWRIVYLLRRTFGKETPENRTKDEQKLARDFHVLPDEKKQPDYTRLDWVGVAARWVELEDR